MLRDYQQRAIDQLYAWFEAGHSGNPCLVLPTGAGKSHIIAALVKDLLQNWPDMRVLMLTHQKELIAQNAAKLREHWPGAPMGIYSAALKRRSLDEPITFAGIMSIARRVQDIGHVDVVLIDEVHTVSTEQSGTYRRVLTELTEINPQMRVIGLTATPYRLGQGMITEGKSALFSEPLIEPVTIEELVRRGFLSVLRSKRTEMTLDTSGVKKQGGEFVASALEAAVDTRANNEAAVATIVERGQDRKSWLVFCAGVSHAHHIAELIEQQGVSVACVTGATAQTQRDQILHDFKLGKIRCVTNVGVLTTGFDHPGVDLIAMLRPTMSPGLYVQMAGRGLRVAEGKRDCLVLDFAGNVREHGPITAVKPPRKAKKGEGEAPSKDCPECGEIVAASVMRCPACGYEWPPVEKPLVLANDDIMGIEPQEMEVSAWQWRKHVSRTSGKEMLACTYYGSLSDLPVTEYLPVAHEGYAGDKAMREVLKIAAQCGVYNELQAESDLSKAAQVLNKSMQPALLKYKREGKFHRVIERVWNG